MRSNSWAPLTSTLDRTETDVTEQSKAYTTNEQADRTARAFGVFLACLGIGVAYLVWPPGVLDATLGTITLGALIRALAAVTIGIASVFVAAMFWS